MKAAIIFQNCSLGRNFMRYLLTQIGPRVLLALGVLVAPAMATVIDFEAQTAARGGSLTGIPDSPLTIGSATFTGGELLNTEVGLNADQTGIYATEGLFGSGETNPLVIQFAAPASNFSILVANGDDARNYTVSDNLGDSVTMSLAPAGGLGTATFSLPGNGLTTVDITSANVDAWDFAIDNVTFTPATSTPEPASLLLIGAGLLLLVALRRKQLSALLRN
jgi:PEP-CTERM motif